MFFFLPDSYGRRKSMLFSLFFFTLGSSLTVFGQTMLLKKIGFAMQGFFHLKITLSFTYLVEFLPERFKNQA